jgi:hypothetical protein
LKSVQKSHLIRKKGTKYNEEKLKLMDPQEPEKSIAEAMNGR